MPHPPGVADRENSKDSKGTYISVPQSDSPLINGKSPEQDDPLDDVQAILKSGDEAPRIFVETEQFQLFGGVLIMSNALVIGLETDLEDWPHWGIVENTFLGLFTVELLIKLCTLGPFKFLWYHADAPWNTFDSLIVGLGMFDFIMSLAGKSGTGGFATIFRIIRLLRILRIFRILKFLKQLYVLIFGLVEAVKAVFWVTILMVFALYVCSIVLVKTVGRPSPDSEHYEFLNTKFGHILDSMLTLFILMSSPNLPDFQVQGDLLDSHIFLTLFLCCFIIFGSYGIVALLTGVISESMFEKNQVRKDQLRVEHEQMRLSLGTLCEELFTKLGDLNPSAPGGEFSVDEVKTLAPEMYTLLQKAGAEITHADAERIIEFMDVNGTGMIGVEEFRTTMDKIAEGLSTMGVQEIASRVGLCESKIDKLQGAMEEIRQGIAQLLARPSM